MVRFERNIHYLAGGKIESINMRLRSVIITIFIISLTPILHGQTGQGFFLDSWQPKIIFTPEYDDVPVPADPVTVAITIDYNDTLTKISPYLFGDNANTWTGCMSDNQELMKHIADRNMGVLRGPGGSISDVFFWNRNVNQRPDDVPLTLAGQSEENWPWYGDRPYPWETWTMDVDSFYSILDQVNATGMITVNYGYARYGTGDDPVANAAHMAAEWVRYDNGRSAFWEIGNEVFGSWEAGYRINTSLNKDGQPEYINATLYGQHCRIFIDSMKAAAQETGADIKIGLVMAEGSSTAGAAWNRDVASQAGDKADFYVVHSYFTPWNTNSGVETIMNSYQYAGDYITYVWNEVAATGKPTLPVALTEYNIFAVGSNQPVSHVNGMHAVLVTGETMKTGYGAALRWDLANGWDNGNDHGMFSYGDEPGVETYAPRPAFYHLYYMQKFTGDVLLNSAMTGAAGMVVIPTAFQSGQVGVILINTARIQKVVRLNIADFGFGDRYYTYILTGTAGEDFSRKVYVNGTGNELVAGGPEDYESIKADAFLIADEVKIKAPPLSVTCVLIEPGTRELVINNEVTSVDENDDTATIDIFPNPSSGMVSISTIPPDITEIEISDLCGKRVYIHPADFTGTDITLDLNLLPGIYFINLSGSDHRITKKLIIR